MFLRKIQDELGAQVSVGVFSEVAGNEFTESSRYRALASKVT